jgi:hypothetical protein
MPSTTTFSGKSAGALGSPDGKEAVDRKASILTKRERNTRREAA